MDYFLIFFVSFLTGCITSLLMHFIFGFINRMIKKNHAESVLSDFQSRHFFNNEDFASYIHSLPLNDLCIILEHYGLDLSDYIIKR